VGVQKLRVGPQDAVALDVHWLGLPSHKGRKGKNTRLLFDPGGGPLLLLGGWNAPTAGEGAWTQLRHSPLTTLYTHPLTYPLTHVLLAHPRTHPPTHSLSTHATHHSTLPPQATCLRTDVKVFVPRGGRDRPADR
jgi:hypothetical protein